MVETDKSKNSSVKILITGAGGLLGGAITQKLAEAGHSCIAFLRREPDRAFPLEVKLKFGDLRQEDCFGTADPSIDLVIHSAALTEYAPPPSLEEVNVQGTARVIRYCIASKAKLLHISTINVELPHLNAYAKSKLKAEELVKSSGLEWAIIRPTMILGGASNGLLKTVRSVRKGVVVPIVGSGRYQTSPIFASDAATVIAALLERPWGNEAIHRLGGAEVIDYISIAKKTAEFEGLSPRFYLHLPFTPLYAILSLMVKFLPQLKGMKEKLLTYPLDKVPNRNLADELKVPLCSWTTILNERKGAEK